MPLYRVQLKQGSRTEINRVEAKSVSAVLAFYKSVSTMRVTEILEIKYEDDSKIPIDDFNYYKVFKGYLTNDKREMKQIIIKNVKKSVRSEDILREAKKYLQLNGVSIKSLVSSLFKFS